MSGPTFVKFLYEDEYCVVAKKVHALSVHPSEFCRDRRTLLSMVRNKCGGQYVYPVHRLDKPVSGPVLFAKSSKDCAAFQKCFEERNIHKHYHAVVRGFLDGAGEMTKPLVKKSTGKLQECLTTYESLAQSELDIPFGKFPTVRYSLVKLEPITGRFHQLRRHMRDMSHPILGDSTDGDSHQNRFFREKFELRRLMLHCHYLSFLHPYSKEWIKIYLPPDSDLWRIYCELGWREIVQQFEQRYKNEIQTSDF